MKNLILFSIFLSTLFSCSASEDNENKLANNDLSNSKTKQESESNKTVLKSLKCPKPKVELPFKTENETFFNNSFNKEILEYERNKDYAGDIFRNEDGLSYSTDLKGKYSASENKIKLSGGKNRSGASSGLFINFPIAEEAVSFWSYSKNEWKELGRTKTYLTDRSSFSAAEYQSEADMPEDIKGKLSKVYSILEGDQSCTIHYIASFPKGTKVIVSDVDGTLTESDNELIKALSNLNYIEKQNASADKLIKTWASKGYKIIYLTARPFYMRSETRHWLNELGFPEGPIISAEKFVYDITARKYKADWLKIIKNELKWDIAAVYGNAESDIEAYEDAEIPKNITFIIGENSGALGTVAIEDFDYSSHIEQYVKKQPEIQ